MNYSNYVDINSAILAGFDYHENQVGFKFEKWTMERKTFWFFLEMKKQPFPYFKKQKKSSWEFGLGKTLTFSNICLQLHYNFGNQVTELSHHAFEMYRLSAFQK